MNNICTVVKLEDGRWQLMLGAKPVYRPVTSEEARQRLEDIATVMQAAYVIGYAAGVKSTAN